MLRKKDEFAKFFLSLSSISGFTLTELIVVITILIILGTISFYSILNYNGSARDTNRVADISNISKVLDLSNVTTGYYPSPDNLFTVTYSGGTLWYQGTVGTGVLTKTNAGIGRLSNKPSDPLKNTEYTYSILAYGNAFQLKTDYEGDVVSYQDNESSRNSSSDFVNSVFIPQASAAAGNPQLAYIKGNYSWITAKTQTGAIICVLPIPSIITSTGSLGGVLEISNNTLSGTLLFNGKPLVWGSAFNPNSVISCSGTYPSTSTLVTGLQNAYTGSDIANLPNIQLILSTSAGNASVVGQSIIKNQLGGGAAPVTYGNCSGTTYSWYTVPSLVHGQTQSLTKSGSTANGTVNYTLPATCTNTILSYGTEGSGVTCNTGYVAAAGNTCVADFCGGTIPANATSTATSQTNSQNWMRNTVAGVCTFDCNSHFTWNSGAGTCDLSTQTGACAALTGNKWYVNNSANYSFTQTWNTGSLTYLPSTTQSYSATPSASTCQYQCQTGYHTEDGGLTCISNTRAAQVCTGLPAGAFWNTVSSITQTWNGSSWAPATAWAYNTTPSTTSCNYQCTAGYYWNGSACVAASTAYYVPTSGASSQTACTNKPGNSNYTASSGLTTNSCPWSCNTYYYQSGGSCVEQVYTATCYIYKPTTSADWMFYAEYYPASARYVYFMQYSGLDTSQYTPGSNNSGAASVYNTTSYAWNFNVYDITLTPSPRTATISISGNLMTGTTSNGTSCTATLN